MKQKIIYLVSLTHYDHNNTGEIDILLNPVGGFYTIDFKEAIEVVNQLNPNTIIPMHYITVNWDTDKLIDSVDKLIENI